MKLVFKKSIPIPGSKRPIQDVERCTDIQIDGKTVGRIHPPNFQTRDNSWGIRFAVKGRTPKHWYWVPVGQRFASQQSAKEWVRIYIKAVAGSYVFHEVVKGSKR